MELAMIAIVVLALSTGAVMLFGAFKLSEE